MEPAETDHQLINLNLILFNLNYVVVKDDGICRTYNSQSCIKWEVGV